MKIYEDLTVDNRFLFIDQSITQNIQNISNFYQLYITYIHKLIKFCLIQVIVWLRKLLIIILKGTVKEK